MKVESNISLKPYNSFGVEAEARRLVKIHTINDVLVAMTAFSGPFKVLGGGSNVIYASAIQDTIFKNEIKGIEIIDEDEFGVMVKVGGGENWHNFVMWAAHHGLCGLENLALIPGTVGAAPIQNIGAYGVEQDQYFVNCTVVDLQSGVVKSFYKSDCKFAYRDSVFKRHAKDQYMITDVTYFLKKDQKPNTTYKDIQDKMVELDVSDPSAFDVAQMVIAIRSNKLPDPKVIGNAGSFFKNPIISIHKAHRLKESYPNVPLYPIDDDHMKVAAAWLIDQCGYKGVIKGQTGTYKNQALVIINQGEATAQEILDFALEIQQTVDDRFGIELTPEVNIWGT